MGCKGLAPVPLQMQGVKRALLPGGRFVADCGGAGNVLSVRVAFAAVLQQHGIDHRAGNPWYFSSDAAARRRLEAAGLQVKSIALVPRPTPMPTDIGGWLDTFASSYFSIVPEDLRAQARIILSSSGLLMPK